MHRVRVAWFSVTVALAVATGCGGTSASPQPDAAADLPAPADADVRIGNGDAEPDLSLRPDGPGIDFEVVPPSCDELPGGSGCPCHANGDCASGFCTFHLGNRICTTDCIDECPTGFACEQTLAFGADPVFVCMSRFPGLCLPCSASSECPSPMDRCVVYPGGLGAFCGGACSADVACPDGYDCKEATTVEGGAATRCMRTSGECDCTDYAVLSKLATPCQATSEFGTCSGWRSCDETGLSACNAKAPAEEVCDNDEDEDCDGMLDDPDVCVICSCQGKECGDDGCGGNCGKCPPFNVCQVDGTCVCVPSCAGTKCGDDGCGGDCGECMPGTKCLFGDCKPGCDTDIECASGDECVGGYCQPDVPDDAVLMAPLVQTKASGKPTDVLKARVKEAGVTPAPGPGPGIVGEIGLGPGGSAPDLQPGEWIWTKAAYEGDDGGFDVWQSLLITPSPGTWAYTFRFSLDGKHWVYADSDGLSGGFDVQKLGMLDVPPPPEITGVVPDHGTVLGGDKVTVTGKHFVDGLVLTFAGAQLAPGKVTSQSVELIVPEHAAGSVAVSLVNPDGQSAKLDDAFTYVLRFTPTLDGKLDEWTDTFQVGTNSLVSNWDAALNSLATLYAAFDATHLYVAVAGWCEGQNYIVGYVDGDFGKASGTAEMIWLSDNAGDGDLDDALSNILEVTAAGFGGDYGFGTRGMASYKEGGNLGDSKFVGWRELGPPYNLSWIQGTVACTDKGIEAAIPLSTLYKGGAPQAGTKVGLVVKLTDRYGDKPGISNQTLPEWHDPADPPEVGAVATFDLIP
ncbi:MAG: hypothetical protein FJ109_02205 [Deltaproteobacteria bacterium]|nr:hypothetical protein [Deltaproteobacteria bacterium]